jgi:hypothetical protein
VEMMERSNCARRWLARTTGRMGLTSRMTQSLENPFFIGRVDGDILWPFATRPTGLTLSRYPVQLLERDTPILTTPAQGSCVNTAVAVWGMGLGVQLASRRFAAA